jgi:16S rRNA (uracil1498-N3)-methyltransferase
MTVRYFVPQFPSSGGQITLPEAESHHASTVMRVRQGDQLILFDGEGHQADATVVKVGRKAVVCQAEAKIFLPRKNRSTIELAIAMPKGDRSRDLVERLTELGVDRLVPIHCQRSPWAISDGAIQKWQRVMIEACKQCRRNQIMQIAQPCRVADFLVQPATENERRWFAHPGGQKVDPDAESLADNPTYRIAIGPEGGFTDQEASAAIASGWLAVGLGERIYRIETAAIILSVKAAGI